MSWYPNEPQNLTRADVQSEIRNFLRSQSIRSSVAPKGVAWQSIDLPLVTAFPLNPQDRDEINLLNATSDEVTRWIYVAAKARWLQIGGPPIGVIEWTGASDAPTGYVKADGTAVSRTTYAGLFALYGTTFGVGDGSTTFNVPNAVNRMFVGAGSTYALGATGGAATHTLDTSEIPGHIHTIASGGSHVHAVSYTTNAADGAVRSEVAASGGGSGTHNTSSAGSHDHGGVTGSAGLSQAHNNMPPYLALTPIIRT